MDVTTRDLKKSEAIQAELDNISLLLIRGFQELQAMDMNYGSYFIPSQTLSQGLERMMKVLLFLSGNFRKGQLKGKFSHDLNKLWSKLIIDKIAEPIFDPYFEIILKILSEFGHNARYFYIAILDGEPLDFNPQEEWENLESRFMNEAPQRYKMLSNGDDADVLIKDIIRRLQIPIEKVINSLSSAIVNYEKREAGWVVPPTIRAFADFNDESFGKSVYQEWPKCLETTGRPHKRTWCDVLISLIHPFRKSRVIYKRNYTGRWPFRNIEKVRIERRSCHKGTFYVITINDYECALNGKTSEKLHLARPYEAGLAVVGISIQPFLDMAKEL